MLGLRLRFVVVSVLLIAYTVVPAYDAFACVCKTTAFSGIEASIAGVAGREFYSDFETSSGGEAGNDKEHLCPICLNVIDKANKVDHTIFNSLVEKVNPSDKTFTSTQYFSIYKPPRA